MVGTIRNTTGCNLSGITFDALGNLYVADAALGGVVWVSRSTAMGISGRVTELPGLRNSADPAVGNNHILELPTSPFLLGKLFCTAKNHRRALRIGTTSAVAGSFSSSICDRGRGFSTPNPWA